MVTHSSANTTPKPQDPDRAAGGTPPAGDDIAKKKLLQQPEGPSPAPNPESAPGGDHVGGEMTTEPFTGTSKTADKPAHHK